MLARLVESQLPGLSLARLRQQVAGLPTARGYAVVVKPLRYRTRPHLAAMTTFEDRRITIQIPEPFRPFQEEVNFGARQIQGKGLRFRWLSRQVRFRSRRDVIRFLYCHEWYHWYLKEVLGRKSAAETACDRFALWNFRRRRVTLRDAHAALRRP